MLHGYWLLKDAICKRFRPRSGFPLEGLLYARGCGAMGTASFILSGTIHRPAQGLWLDRRF
jgi:hypothetical protein